MRVAIDSGPLFGGHSVRGIGFYTKNLIDALGKKVEAVDFKETDLTKYDLVHYPSFHPFLITLPFKKPTKMVVTVHDVTPLIYPKHYPPGIRGGLRFLVQKFLLKKVEAVITDTEASKKDIIRFLGIPPDRIFPIHLAPAKRVEARTDQKTLKQVRKKYHLPQKYVLYVGDVNYNKNLHGLIHACRLAKLPLVICGKQALEIEEEGMGLDKILGPRDWIRFVLGRPHPEHAHYAKIAKHFREKKEEIFCLGFVPDEDIAAVYKLATVYCQPSFYEGFGLPVLEAMVYGTPVVAGKTQALVEIAQGAALFVNPKDPREMAKKITRIVKSPEIRSKLVEKSKKKVKEYSWKKTAKQTYDVYHKALSK
jgi:glycosyltransferase involved in cell wall biosynthesis